MARLKILLVLLATACSERGLEPTEGAPVDGVASHAVGVLCGDDVQCGPKDTCCPSWVGATKWFCVAEGTNPAAQCPLHVGGAEMKLRCDGPEDCGKGRTCVVTWTAPFDGIEVVLDTACVDDAFAAVSLALVCHRDVDCPDDLRCAEGDTREGMSIPTHRPRLDVCKRR